MNNAVHHPYMFDREFAVEDSAHESGDDPKDDNIATALSEQDDAQATWQEGHDEGVEVGYARALASLQQQTSESLSQISRQLTEIANSDENTRNVSIDQVSKLAKAIALPLVGRLLSESPTDPIVELATYCLAHLYGETEITIRVPADLCDAVSETLNSIAENTQNSPLIQVRADTTLIDTNCKIEWSSGQADRNETKLWEMVDQTIRNRIGCDDPATNDPLAASSSILKDAESDLPHPNEGAGELDHNNIVGSLIIADADLESENGTSETLDSLDESLAPPKHGESGNQRENGTINPLEENDETLAIALGPEIREANRVAIDQEGRKDGETTSETDASIRGNNG